MRAAPAALAALAALGLVVTSSCADPVQEMSVTNLGPEAPGIAAGARHRAGQPCLVCHGGRGPAELELSVAGTVFVRERGAEGAADVGVVLRDARGTERTARTNDVGNFYLTRSEWDLAFPLRVELARGTRPLAMRTEIPREGSCNACHRGEGDTLHMPGVYLEAAP